MNTRIATAIALKLFAIYIIVSVVMSMPAIIGSYLAVNNQNISANTSIVIPLTIVICTIIIGALVFLVLWKLSNRVLNDAGSVATERFIDHSSMERFLLLLLGMYFSISALVELPNVFTSLWIKSERYPGISIVDYAWLGSVVFQLIIGISIMAGIKSWLLFIRGLGVK